MKKVEIYQSLWGMTDLLNKEAPWSFDEQIQHIKDAGFDGVLQSIEDYDKKTQAQSELILSKGLKLGVSCLGYDLDDIGSKLHYAKKYKAEFVNIMVKDYFIIGDEAISLLDRITQLGQQMEVPTYIETHRGTITQDLIRTVDYVKLIPNLALTIDFSHYVVSGEIDHIDEKVEACFDELLKRTAAIHIRISNGEQVQVPLQSMSEAQYNQFIRWWKKGIQYARGQNIQQKPFPIVVELGPETYQQKIRTHDGIWIYDCNRWEEALRWMEIVRNF